MKHTLLLLATLPVLAGCGDAADESDDPVAAESELTTGAPADPASVETPESGATEPGTTESGTTEPGTGTTSTAPPPAVGTDSPADPATVPPTNQDAQYQDSVTEQPEVAP
jgi:hypothetical protein